MSKSKVIGPSNHITCKLCKIKLETESKLRNHVKNCWLHNQSNHVYCIPCGKPYGNPQSLAKHFQNQTNAARHANFRRNNGPHVLDSNADDFNENHQRPLSANDINFHFTDSISSEKGLPLIQWLKIQQENPDNVVALEPDPFQSNRNIPLATFTVSESSPIKCKLCLQLLTSNLLLRNHVEICWSQNKSKHRYCVPCNGYYKSGFCPRRLRQHQRYKHKNALYQKPKQDSSWSCTVCHKDMRNELVFNAHQESLQIFLDESSKNESSDFVSPRNPNVDSTQAQYSDTSGQKGTMKDLLGWLTYIRKIRNSDGTANLVLIDPEPTTHSSGEVDKDINEVQINENNPITCRLCLKKLTRFEHVQIHVKVCWSRNKERHCYCVSCEKGFATPNELQKHKSSEHPAPKNILLLHQLLNVDGLDVNFENTVTCKLCETELVSTVDVKIHGENCWLHNKIRHVFCTICDQRFDDPVKLRHHNSNQHQLSKACAPSENENNQQTNRTEPEKNPSLRQWLTIHQEIDSKNIIALEPDPLKSETVTVSDSSPVKCKLCKELLTTEADLKTHATICWLHNKGKHCYCIPCNLNFATNSYLLVHNQAKHLNHPLTALTCLKCNHEFHTESEFAKHKESLRRFLSERKNENPSKNVNAVGFVDGSNTMAYLFEWLKRLRQIKNLDGSENIILVDPEPEVDNFEEIKSENPITCRLCLQKFTEALALRRHVKASCHRFCVICKQVFKKPQHLQDHSRTEHSEMQRDSFTCAFCDQEFFDEKTIEEHEEAHKDPNFLPFKCPHCSVSLKDKADLLKHVTAVHRGLRKVVGFKCKICLKSFPRQNALDDHNRLAHTGERPFKCKFPNCSYTTYSTGIRQLHYRSKHMEELGLEPEQFLCPTCGKVFEKLLRLTRHLKISHTQEKPYKCTHQGCTKAFKTSTQLTEHVRVHTGEKPYVCEECGQAFARSWSFTKHKRSHEGTLNRAQCHLCPRKFLGGWELKQHLKIHEERKEFKCQFCEVECATESYLKKHEKTHGNESDSNSEDDGESSAGSNV